MPNPGSFDVVVTYAPNIFDTFQSVLGNALVGADAGRLRFGIEGADLYLADSVDPDGIRAILTGSGLAVDADGRPSGFVSSAEFFGFDGAANHAADWRTGGLDIGEVFDIVSANAYFFFHPRGAPDFFSELHGGQRMLSRGSNWTDVIEVFGPDDVAVGRKGNDTFYMSTSVGRIDGGKGRHDEIDMFRAESGAKINFKQGVIRIAGEETGIKGIEHISATDFGDVVRSDGKGHEIRTWNGRDKVIARTGDTVDTGNGADEIAVFGDDVTVNAGNQDDDIFLRSGRNHTVNAGPGADVIVSAGIAATIDGGAGDDTFRIDDGTAKVSGGKGMDRFVFRGLEGRVVIADYQPGEEIEVFEVGSGVDVVQDGDNATIRFLEGTVVILNTDIADLNVIGL